MKTVKVIVNAYVSTMQTVEVEDDFDINDDNFMYDLAHLDLLQEGLRDNLEDCIRENAEVVMIEDAETDELLYEA